VTRSLFLFVRASSDELDELILEKEVQMGLVVELLSPG
jgi:hypothetical protein